MHRLRPLMMTAACAILLAAAPFARLPDLPQDPTKPDVPWQSWLMRVQHVDRRDLLPDDVERIRNVEATLDQADTPREKRIIERRLESVRAEAAARAGFVIYGWAMMADQRGRPVTTTNSMAGFFIPGSAAAEKMFRNMQSGDCIAIDRRDSQHLFSFAGRRFVSAKRAMVAQGVDTLLSNPVSVPPSEPLSEGLRRSIELELKHYQTADLNENTRHRFMLQVQADGAASTGGELTLWMHVRFVTADGEVFGPIIDAANIPRSTKTGNFSVTRSFDVIVPPGFEMDPKATSVELVNAR